MAATSVIACGILVSAFRTRGAFADVARTAGDVPGLRDVESITAAPVTELYLVVFMVERVRWEREKSPADWVYVGLAVCFLMPATSNFADRNRG